MGNQKKIIFCWEIVYNLKGQVVIKKRYIRPNLFVFYRLL